METILIVPGLGDSSREHWQSWLQARLPNSLRVVQPDWHTPNLGVWRRTVRQAVRLVRGKVWMVAHSFGCLAAVCVAADRPGRIAGMMLVAPADPCKFGLERLLPETPLDCASVVVASSDDPWLHFPRAVYWAERWGSRFCNLGAAGHINMDSGFGPWPQGLDILRALQKSAAGGLAGADSLNQPRKVQGTLAMSGYVEKWLGISRAYFAQDLREANTHDTPLALVGLCSRAATAPTQRKETIVRNRQ